MAGDGGIVAQQDSTRARDAQMPVVGGDVRRGRLQRLTLDRHGHADTADAIEPLDQASVEADADVLDDEKRNRKPWAESRNDLGKCRRPPRGRGDGDHLDIGLRPTRPVTVARAARRGPTPSDDPNLGELLHRRDKGTGPGFEVRTRGPAGLGQHREGPGRDGAERPRHLVGLHGADHHDGRWGLAHDAARRFEPIHDRHLHVHGDQVGRESGGQTHRLFAIHRLPRNQDVRVGRQDAGQELSGGGRVVDHQHARQSHVRSTAGRPRAGRCD